MYRPRRLLPAGLLALSLAWLPGCTEPIRTYEVPVVKQRLLGAMILTDREAWFVKLMGRADDVAGQKDNFITFVRSLRFPEKGKEPIAWTVPEGWEHKPGKEMRYASFAVPNGLEVTVFKFGAEGKQVLANVNRWRDQLKLEPIDGRELMRICKTEKLEGGVEALVVDLESARTAALREESAPTGRPFDYKTPAGWVEKPDSGPIAKAAFTIDSDGQHADVTITPLSGGGGAISANINRWREQLGLPDAGEEQLRKDARIMKVDGEDSVLVELVGPAGKSILAAICPGGNQTWFVKMMGDGELVAKEKATFETFLGTLKFRGGQ